MVVLHLTGNTNLHSKMRCFDNVTLLSRVRCCLWKLDCKQCFWLQQL